MTIDPCVQLSRRQTEALRLARCEMGLGLGEAAARCAVGVASWRLWESTGRIPTLAVPSILEFTDCKSLIELEQQVIDGLDFESATALDLRSAPLSLTWLPGWDGHVMMVGASFLEDCLVLDIRGVMALSGDGHLGQLASHSLPFLPTHWTPWYDLRFLSEFVAMLDYVVTEVWDKHDAPQFPGTPPGLPVVVEAAMNAGLEYFRALEWPMPWEGRFVPEYPGEDEAWAEERWRAQVLERLTSGWHVATMDVWNEDVVIMEDLPLHPRNWFSSFTGQ